MEKCQMLSLSLSKKSYQIYNCLKVKPSFHEKLFQKEKINCYGFMPGDFQVICGSMVGENLRSSASTKTPDIHAYIDT